MDLIILSITISVCSFGLTIHLACRLFKAENQRAFLEDEAKERMNILDTDYYMLRESMYRRFKISDEFVSNLVKQTQKKPKPPKKRFQITRGESVHHVTCETYYKSDGALWFVDGGCDNTPVAVFPLSNTIVETVKQ